MLPGCTRIRARSLRISYARRVVLNLDELALDAGDASAGFILGANGAGKTTLLNALSGFVPPGRSAQVWLDTPGDSVRIEHLAPHRIVSAGIARTFQRPLVSPAFTVRDAVALAAIAGSSVWASFDQVGSTPMVAALLRALGLEAIGNRPLGVCPLSVIRRVELARALACQPAVLLLDEPTAGSDDADREWLASFVSKGLPELVSTLHSKGVYRFPRCTTWVVTHDIPFARNLSRARQVAARAIVLDGGAIASAGTLDSVLSDPVVLDAWIGERRSDAIRQ